MRRLNGNLKKKSKKNLCEVRAVLLQLRESHTMQRKAVHFPKTLTKDSTDHL